MAVESERESYFTKHLFRTGLECPTRLYYKAKAYPENEEFLPFIAHYRYNKNQLISLARSSFPKGVQVNDTASQSALLQTEKLLNQNQATVFDPVFVAKQCMARIPILDKKGNRINLYQFHTRAFKAKKHSLSDNQGNIYAKWLDYLIDFAYRVHIIQKCHADFEILPIMVLPSKYALAQSEALPEKLRKINKGELSPEQVSSDVDELLIELDVKGEVDSILSGAYFKDEFKGRSFDEVLDFLTETFFNENKYPVKVGPKCKNCEFRLERDRVVAGEKSGFRECWEEANNTMISSYAGELVFDLIGPGTKRWVKEGIYFQQEVPQNEYFDLESIQRTEGRISEKQRQSLQIMKARGIEIPKEIVKKQLFTELDRWEYPIHFLDFEAGNYAVPTRKDRNPYHLLVFQFSCHSLQEDGSWTHQQWLHESDSDYSNYQLVRRLMKIPDILKGTLVQYSEFERNALKTVRKEIKKEKDEVSDASELYSWLSEIIRRNDSTRKTSPYLADLSRMVKSHYYNSQMQDSLSIKDVLQSVMTVSPRLKELYSQPYSSSNFKSMIWWQPGSDDQARSPYRLITKNEEKVQDVRRGTEAMVVYSKLLSEDLTKEQRQAYKKALLRYCEVDTLAMLMIYQHWAYLKEDRN